MSLRLPLTRRESIELVTRLDDLAELEVDSGMPRIRDKLLKAMGIEENLTRESKGDG